MSGTDTKPELALDFIPVALSNLQVDSVTDFDLYILPGDGAPPVLYRRKDRPFTEAARARLIENKVDKIFIDPSQEDAYQQYMERHLGKALRDENVDMAVKSRLFYDTARGLVKQVLAAPRSGDVVKRSAALVEHTAGFMLREPTALASLMSITSFDYYTYTHSVNVFVFSMALAQRLDVPEAPLKRFAMGALLHDIGKGLIDPDIINRKGRLSPDEWQVMKKHPVYGYDILRKQGVTDTLMLDVTRHHHEKLGGNGYPDGLAAKDLSMFARITTIADIFDALTTRRSYKTAMNSFPALNLMKSEMAGELDDQLFRQFVLMVGSPSP